MSKSYLVILGEPDDLKRIQITAKWPDVSLDKYNIEYSLITKLEKLIIGKQTGYGGNNWFWVPENKVWWKWTKGEP